MAEETVDIRVSEIMPDLFSDWITVPFEDALSNSVGEFTKLKQTQTELNGKYPVVDQGEELINGFVNDPELLYKGELPVIIFGDHTRRTKLIDFRFAVGADGTKILIPKPFIDIHFFFYYLKSLNIVSEGYSRHYKFLKESKVPIPPLPEQHRIVAKLNAVMKKVEASKQHLDKIPTLLKRFRQSVLAAAVSGKLTEEQAEHDVERVPLGYLIEGLKYGTSQKSEKDNKGVPILRIPNIGEDGRIITDDLKFADLPKDEYAKLKLEAGDILLIRSNGSVSLLGRAAIISKEHKDYAYAGYLIRLRCDRKKLLPEFLIHVLASYDIRAQIEMPSRSSSGVNNINSDEVKALSIPSFTIEGQKEIVRRVEQLFAFADKLEARYTKAKVMLDKLPQSILAKAFRGELEAQDPNDEPASVLLERIRAEKAQLVGAKKVSNSKATNGMAATKVGRKKVKRVNAKAK
jgi:type I restriction enzyme S subunit